MTLFKSNCKHGRELGTGCPNCVKDADIANEEWLESLKILAGQMCGTCEHWQPGYKPLGECMYQIKLPDSITSERVVSSIKEINEDYRPMAWNSGSDCLVYKEKD